LVRTRIISTGIIADLGCSEPADVQTVFPDVLRARTTRCCLLLGDVKPEEGFALAKSIFARFRRGGGATVCGSAGASAGGRAAGTRRGKNSGPLPRWPSAMCCRRGGRRSGSPWRCWTRALHGAGPGAHVHRELVLESRLPLEADGGIERMCSGTTGQRN